MREGEGQIVRKIQTECEGQIEREESLCTCLGPETFTRINSY